MASNTSSATGPSVQTPSGRISYIEEGIGQRFLAAFDNTQTLAIEARLKTLTAPTLIVWGTDDVFFDVKWAGWLADTIPEARRPVEFKGARIFFPEERWADFNKELRTHWLTASADGVVTDTIGGALSMRGTE